MRPVSFSLEREIYRNDFLRLYSVKADFGTFSKEYFVTDEGCLGWATLARKKIRTTDL